MVSGALLWVFIGVGLALMTGTAALGIRRLLGGLRPGFDLVLIAALIGYAGGGAMLLYALFPRSVI